MMSDVPEHWVSTTVLEIAELVRGVTYKKEQARDENGPGLVPLLRANNINQNLLLDDQLVYVPVDVVKETQRLRPNDVVLAMSSGSKSVVGKTARFHGAEAPFTFGAFCGVLRPSPDIDSTYFALALESPVYRRYVSTVAAGVNINNLRRAHLEDYQIPVPPVIEQQAIATKVEALFSELDAGVAQLEAAQVLLKRYRQSVLKAAFEGRLTADWREHRRKEAEANGEKLPTAQDLLKQIEAERQERTEQQHAEWQEAVRVWESAGGKDSGEKKPRRPARPKDPPPLTEEELASLPELPEGWGWTRADMLVEADRPICYGILMPKDNVEQGVLYVKVRDMRGDRINVDALQRTSPEIAKEYERATLREGDVLLAIRGTYGRVAVVPAALEGGNITQDSARLSITPLGNRDFCAWTLRAPECQHFFKRVARGVAVKGVNIGDVRLCPMPLCSTEEMAEIVKHIESRLSVIDDIESTTQTALLEAKALRQSILKRAFEGRLLDESELEAVRSDPDYEPAEKLLERIRAQSEAAKPAKKKAVRKKRSSRKTQETT